MIRNVNTDDAAAINSIYNEYILNSVASFETELLSEEQMNDRINDISGRFPYMVYEDNGKILGYCYAHPWKERAAYAGTWETTVYVAPDSLRNGIGETLMKRLIEECRMAGIHSLIACITGSNTPSIRLHEKLGFSKVSYFPEVGQKFGRLLDVTDYQLIL